MKVWPFTMGIGIALMLTGMVWFIHEALTTSVGVEEVQKCQDLGDSYAKCEQVWVKKGTLQETHEPFGHLGLIIATIFIGTILWF